MQHDWRKEFSIQAYRKMLGILLSRGYKFTSFSNFEADSCIIMRHDIDFCIDAALKLALLENELDIATTYFVQLRSPLYNALSESSIRKLHTIQSVGHDIGVHVDLALYEDNLPKNIQREISVFEELVPFSLSNIVSFHRPGKSLDRVKSVQVPGLLHTYEPRYFEDIAYISDSTGRWRYGHPTTSLEFAERKTMQILTHPIWWVYKGRNAQEKIWDFIFHSKDRTIEYIKDTAVSFQLRDSSSH